MSLVLHRSDVGEDLREPLSLAPRRRRLWTILKQEARHRPKGRPYIVSVHRKGTILQPCDETRRLRKNWKTSLVGPHDTVVITYLPLGGAMAKQAGGGGKAIGAAVAMIAIAVAAPYLVGALGAASAGLGSVLGTTGALTLTGKIVAAGLVAGFGYLVSKATQPKAKKGADSGRPLYGVGGGGNVARAGDRIPVHYGRVWHQPDLSQPDYFVYNGDDQILFKKLTLGAGKYKIHSIRIGQALMWTENNGLRPPFTGAEIEFMQPGERSELVPGSVFSAENVTGIDLGYSDDPSPWSGPFPVTPPGVTTKRIQLDWSYPNGYWIRHPKKPNALPCPYGVEFQICDIDEDGNRVGNFRPLYKDEGEAVATRAVRKTHFATVPEGRYAVRARNITPRLAPPLEEQGVSAANAVMWDGLRAHLRNEPLKPGIQEISMKISAEAMGSTLTFSDVWIEMTRILPVWNGAFWVEQETRKAVWAGLDVIRNQDYGGAYSDSKIDLPRFLHYANTVNQNDTFDGTIRGPVSVFEAASTVLGVIRAEPFLVGDTWTMIRDEPRAYQKHVISRRQIVKDSTGVDYDLDVSDGIADVILEYYRDGDPRRRAEVRATYGSETITPRLINGFGVTSHDHALALCRWFAATAYYRREARSLSVERLGRTFERNSPAMIDAWFVDPTQAAGVESRSGLTLTLDIDFTLPAGAHIVLRDQKGMEWGPVAITAGAEPRTVVLDADDVAVITEYTGRSLANIFGRSNRRLPVTVLIGTLQELSRPYIIRTAKPEGLSKAQITAVYDAPEVWIALGEQIPPAPPIREVILDESELAPVLPWVRGHLVQKATAIVLEWSVAPARGCRRYRVDIRYGTEGAWQNVHNGEGTSGSYAVEYRPNVDLSIRAFAINGRDIPSDPVFTSCKLFKPYLNSEITDMLIELEMLQEQVRRDIAEISKIGKDTLRGNLQKLNDKIEELANAAATEAGNSYENRQLIKVAVGDAMAAIQHEVTLRITADEALAQEITTLLARMGTAEAAIQTETTARVTADEAIASQITTLQASVSDANAAITQEATVRAAADSAQATQIGVLQTSVGNHTATLTQYGTSIDGIKAQYGVSISIDGQTGGFILEGARKLDGTVSFSFGIRGNLIVDGTIFGTKLAAQNVITASAQIGFATIEGAHIKNLTVDNLNIKDGAVSSIRGSTAAATAAQVSINVRSGAKVMLIATYHGSPAVGRPLSSGGSLVLKRNGSNIESVVLNWAAFFNPNTNSHTYGFLETTIVWVDDSAPAGANIYRVESPLSGVTIVAMEMSK